jgi:nucleoside-diphosphate-sugar epimerase
VASSLKQLSDLNPESIFFASGVANSKACNYGDFYREKKLLSTFAGTERTLIYFSTMSVYDDTRNSTSYVQHKLEMENMVSTFSSYVIFRLPEVVGTSKNKSTLVNFLYEKITTESSFELWKDAKRNLIDIQDATSWIIDSLKSEGNRNCIIDICSDRDHLVSEVVQTLEKITNQKAKFRVVEKIIPPSESAGNTVKRKFKLVIETSDSYLENTLRKYYD